MKKAGLILLICIYSLVTMGFSLKQFYCCGKFKSATFSLMQASQKNCSEGDGKAGCCDTKYKFFKVKDKHITAEKVKSLVPTFVELLFVSPSFQEFSFTNYQPVIAHSSHAPPLRTGIPSYIYNCVFRI